MTDKELKKLSRLELLELLLEASKENQKNKEIIEKLTAENKTAESIENLSTVTKQMQETLNCAENIAATLKNISGDADATDKNDRKESICKSAPAPVKAEVLADRNIYLRMLCFFAKNDDKLSVFPEEIETLVRERIRSILERKSIN